MSSVTIVASTNEKKRPSVSTKCLLNIKSIVTQNALVNKNNKSTALRSTTSLLPPLPLVSTKESSNHCKDKKEIEENLPRNTQMVCNEDFLPEKFVSKIPENKEMTMMNEHDKSIPISHEQNHTESPSSAPSIIPVELNSKQYPNQTLNQNESIIIPPLPLSSSMYPFGPASSSPQKKPLTSFPIQSSNRINEEYLIRMHDIIASSSSSSSDHSNQIKPIELSIYRQQLIPIHRFDSESPTISTNDDDDDDEDENLHVNNSLIFINSSFNLPINSNSPTFISDQPKSRLSERFEKEVHHHQPKLLNNSRHSPQEFNPRCSTSYTRLPPTLRNNNLPFNHPSPTGTHPPLRRSFPQFESVRTPVQKSPTIKSEIPSLMSAELFDCCQSEKNSSPTQQTSSIENQFNELEIRANYFRDVGKIREIMINASKRLTQGLSLSTKLPIVDTHCHFDLIFDRLRIKHNNIKKYFDDYKEFYPSDLSFELAIQVFWRPKQLTEENWKNWYSKYLDDERVYGSCGIHPHWSSKWNEKSLDDIERCLQHPKIVAIGEIGLDFGPKNVCLIHEQRRAFEAQLKLAAKWLKPIVIHSRDAYIETFQLMKQHLEPNHKIHLHCFVGTLDDVSLFTSYFTRIKFGFTPIITRFDFLHTVIEQLDLTQILSETDSPYFAPDELHAFSRCAHPGMVYSVVEMIAQLRHLPVFDVACQLRENARQIYGI